jgi:hypothetical protein
MTQTLSDGDLDTIKIIRQRMRSEIPADLDTDFYLARWCHLYDGKLDDLLAQFRLFIENRHAIGADQKDILDRVHTNASSKYLRYLPVSLLADRPINQKDQSIVFFQRVQGFDFNKVLKVIKMGDLLSMFFANNEYYSRLIQKHEAINGRPCSAQMILDLENVDVMDYVNPMGAPLQALRCMTYVGDTWFGDQNSRLYIVNPPAIISLIWQIAKRVLSARSQQKLVLIHKYDELLQYISPNALPRYYGGELVDETGWGDPNTCCNVPKQVSKDAYYPVGRVFANLSSPPQSRHETIKHGKTFTVIRTVDAPGKWLAYQFSTNNEVEFSVMFVTDKKRVRVRPRFLLMTPKIPEEDAIECKETGEYHLEFTNSTCYWFPVKLQYAAEMLDSAPPSLAE